MPSRCFVAVELPQTGLRLLADARQALLDEAPDWAGEKWVRPELVHLTLKYIGPLPAGAIAEAMRALEATCMTHAPFDLTLTGIRAIPSDRQATMLWATLGEDTRACADLAGAMDAMLAKDFGVPADEREFRPHVTLARARVRRSASAVALAAAQARFDAGKGMASSVSVRSVTLYSSTLGPEGPVYETLGSVSLGGPGSDRPLV